jgi:hypothetical protein
MGSTLGTFLFSMSLIILVIALIMTILAFFNKSIAKMLPWMFAAGLGLLLVSFALCSRSI